MTFPHPSQAKISPILEPTEEVTVVQVQAKLWLDADNKGSYTKTFIHAEEHVFWYKYHTI